MERMPLGRASLLAPVSSLLAGIAVASQDTIILAITFAAVVVMMFASLHDLISE